MCLRQLWDKRLDLVLLVLFAIIVNPKLINDLEADLASLLTPWYLSSNEPRLWFGLVSEIKLSSLCVPFLAMNRLPKHAANGHVQFPRPFYEYLL